MDLQKSNLVVAILLLLGAFVCSAEQTTKLYRWTDEKGNVYYSDKIPPQHSRYGRAKLNEQGVKVDEVEGAKTRAQLTREARLQQLRNEQQRLLQDHQAKDRALLRTFRSEQEIEDTLDGKLSTIEVLETVTYSNIKRLETLLERGIGQAAELERNGKPVSDRLRRSIDNTRAQLDDNHEKIKSLGTQKLALKRKYARDLERFRALVAASEGALFEVGSDNESVNAGVDDKDSVIISVARCPNKNVCDRVWKLAKSYVASNATTPIRIDTGVIIYTASPVKESDIALSVSRITRKGSDSAQIFLDARCRQSGVGQELCDSEEVRGILSKFPAFINASINP